MGLGCQTGICIRLGFWANWPDVCTAGLWSTMGLGGIPKGDECVDEYVFTQLPEGQSRQQQC